MFLPHSHLIMPQSHLPLKHFRVFLIIPSFFQFHFSYIFFHFFPLIYIFGPSFLPFLPSPFLSFLVLSSPINQTTLKPPSSTLNQTELFSRITIKLIDKSADDGRGNVRKLRNFYCKIKTDGELPCPLQK